MSANILDKKKIMCYTYPNNLIVKDYDEDRERVGTDTESPRWWNADTADRFSNHFRVGKGKAILLSNNSPCSAA